MVGAELVGVRAVDWRLGLADWFGTWKYSVGLDDAQSPC